MVGLIPNTHLHSGYTTLVYWKRIQVNQLSQSTQSILGTLLSWSCLAYKRCHASARYSKLMGDEPDLDPDINKDFFENNVLQLEPSLLTENGMKCFERFFKAVNCREGKLVAKRRAYMMDDLELIGLDYLWRVSQTPTYAFRFVCGFHSVAMCQYS